jgi:CMP-N-acetylneuraminic acid synthetase
MLNVIAIIPARGGSKGVPRKNIRLLGDKPLIAWTIETSLRSKILDRVIVSTDDHDIAELSVKVGAEIPFLRPSELAQDDTPDLPVYLHVLDYLAKQENYHPDVVVWLRPTSPLRLAEDVENTVNILISNEQLDCVRSVCLAEHHPYWMKKLEDNCLIPFLHEIDENKFYRRQLLPPVYRLNGAVDVSWCKNVIEKKQLYAGKMAGYIMPPERSVDLDSELDFALAEVLLNRRNNESNN